MKEDSRGWGGGRKVIWYIVYGTIKLGGLTKLK
jgi:hypothetical protein